MWRIRRLRTKVRNFINHPGKWRAANIKSFLRAFNNTTIGKKYQFHVFPLDTVSVKNDCGIKKYYIIALGLKCDATLVFSFDGTRLTLVQVESTDHPDNDKIIKALDKAFYELLYGKE